MFYFVSPFHILFSQLIMSKAYTTGMKDTSNIHTNEVLSEDQENGFKKETDKHENSLEREKAFDLVKNAYENILIGLGLDPTRESLRKTPARAANALLGFAKGYRETVKGSIPSLYIILK